MKEKRQLKTWKELREHLVEARRRLHIAFGGTGATTGATTHSVTNLMLSSAVPLVVPATFTLLLHLCKHKEKWARTGRR